jgi:aminoglycoside phosphotransferase (APT) family kinase protein
MTAKPMPSAEVDVDEPLVRRLLADQHPDLADLPLTVVANGWDNVIYRLGDDLAVRLPRRAVAAVLVENEQRWLPELAARLPLPIPVPIRTGQSSDEYPWSWSVVPWFDGGLAAVTPPTDQGRTAAALAGFVVALHVEAPAVAPANPFRGGPLSERDAPVRERTAQLASVVDGPAILALWEEVSAVRPWRHPPVWLHGDLHGANLLVTDGRLSAVIDFGDITAGDPATDLSVSWQLFDAHHRAAFFDRLGTDTDTRTRARAWALHLSLAYLANSADNPLIASIGRTTLGAVLAGE